MMDRRRFLFGSGALGALAVLDASRAVAQGGAEGGVSEARRVAWAAANTSPGASEPLETASHDLTPYTGTWGDAQLRHLLRRSMFGVPPAQFAEAQGLGSMPAVIARLFQAADVTKVPLPAQPAAYLSEYLIPTKGDTTDAINKARLDIFRQQQLINWWFTLMASEHLSIREKMTLFWTNHFVTGYSSVNHAAYMYTYLQTCRQYALGNLKTFTMAITTDPAMLYYLNGNQSYVNSKTSFVNENYARELMELFTLGLIDPVTGQPNYTESDVQNAARALTGWVPRTTAPFVGQLDPTRHDTGTKTFLGQTGNFGVPEIINIIFSKGTPAGYTPAYFICQKLYAAFVYEVPDPQVVDAMAHLLINQNFEIAPVMQALLSSAHFYDVNVIGAQLKSPAEFAGSLVREFALSYPAFSSADPPVASTDTTGSKTYTDPNPTLSLITAALMGGIGQKLLEPPNVKGWPGGRNWISTGTFSTRENASNAALLNLYTNAKLNLALGFDPDRYATQLSGATLMPAGTLSATLTASSLSTPLDVLEAGDLKKLISRTYPEPNYKYESSDVGAFAVYLTSLPEFQLI